MGRSGVSGATAGSRQRGLKLKKRGAIFCISGTLPNGQRVRESLRTARPDAAEQLFALRSAELHKVAIFGPLSDHTFAEAVVAYLEDSGEARFMRPILDAWHNRLLRDIRPGHIRDLAIKLYPKGSAATRNRQGIVPAVAVINHAADRGHCPPIRVRRFKVQKTDRAAVDRDWISAFREHASSDYIAALALFMFQTGARLGEAVSLTPASLDLANRQARLARTKNGEPHSYQLTTAMARELAGLPPRNDRVFGYRSRHSVYTPWRSSCARADIAYVPPHQAGRHSFATEMIVRHGADIVTTARMGNWKSVRLLLETYTHAENLRSVADEVFGDQLPDVPRVARAFLYVMRTRDFYKVGRTRDVEMRRSEIQASCPTPVKIVMARSYAEPLVPVIENMVHEILSHHRHSGEWFACSISTIQRAIRQAEGHLAKYKTVAPMNHRLGGRGAT